MALCDLKRREWSRAVDTTTEILQRNSKNTKVSHAELSFFRNPLRLSSVSQGACGFGG